MSGAGFDRYAPDYDRHVDRALAPSGESRTYFARERLVWLARCLRARREPVEAVIDYGCGTGGATPFLFTELDASSVLGVDMSARSLEVARREHGWLSARFVLADDYRPDGRFDLALTCNVFHHIPVDERPRAVDDILRSLRPGGLFSFWEQNAWSPATRYVMSRCEFDRDAIPLTPPTSRRLLRAGGFDVLATDFLFVFPHALRRLRPLERRIARLPLGAQYQVLCRRP